MQIKKYFLSNAFFIIFKFILENDYCKMFQYSTQSQTMLDK